MTRFAFTGPSKLSPEEDDRAAQVVAALTDPTEITTGAASGWDTEVCLAALAIWPEAQHRIVTPGARFNLLGVNQALELARRLKVQRFEIITLPAPAPKHGAHINSLAYRARNHVLVDHCDVMVAAVRSADPEPVFYRSGEWLTVNLAVKAGRRVDFVRLAPQ